MFEFRFQRRRLWLESEAQNEGNKTHILVIPLKYHSVRYLCSSQKQCSVFFLFVSSNFKNFSVSCVVSINFHAARHNSHDENTIFLISYLRLSIKSKYYSQKWRKHIIKYISYLSRLCYIILYPESIGCFYFRFIFSNSFSIYLYERHNIRGTSHEVL